jgi:hypothetical protein
MMALATFSYRASLRRAVSFGEGFRGFGLMRVTVLPSVSVCTLE